MSMHAQGVSPVIAARQIALNPPMPPAGAQPRPSAAQVQLQQMQMQQAAGTATYRTSADPNVMRWIGWSLYIFGLICAICCIGAILLSFVSIIGIILVPWLIGMLISAIGFAGFGQLMLAAADAWERMVRIP